MPIHEPFHGTLKQRALIRTLTSSLISRYIRSLNLRIPINVSESRVEIEEQHYLEVTMLKELTWHYVIYNPAIATQQHGKEQVIENLFKIYMDALTTKPRWSSIFPSIHLEHLKKMVELDFEDDEAASEEQAKARLVADVISVMSDNEAVTIYQRLVGIYPGLITDRLYR